MKNLSTKGFFKLNKKEIDIIKQNFCAEKISDVETLNIIKDIEIKYNFILDPHTATAVVASQKIKNNSDTIILGTAHPFKFLETVKLATGKEIDPPSQLSSILDKKENYDILENKVLNIKNYIIEKLV